MNATIENAKQAGIKFYQHEGKWFCDTPGPDQYRKTYGGWSTQGLVVREAAAELFDDEMGWIVSHPCPDRSGGRGNDAK